MGFVEIGGTAQSGREGAGSVRVRAPEAASIVAKSSVPFAPSTGDAGQAVSGTECADLVGSGGIPSFGDEFCIGKYGVFGNPFQDGSGGAQVSISVARKDACEIKTKSINVVV